MPSKILVTGATGNVGSQVVKHLSAQGGEVLAAVHSRSRIGPIEDLGVDLVEVDFDRPETFASALKGVEKVFLLTPLVQDMAAVGAAIVEEIKNAGVKYIVRLSGLGADADPGITLGRWHREVERAIETSGIPYTILRPNSFMQNYATLFGYTIKTQNAFYLPVDDAKVSLVDTRDIAAVAVAALTGSGHEGSAYNVTGPEAISNHEIAAILSRLLGREINYVSVSDDDARHGMQDSGMPQWLIDVLAELYAVQKAGYTAATSDVVENVTGRKPRTFEEFARDNADAFG